MSQAFGRRLGQRLRARREARQLTQARVAELAELTPNYIGLLERGEKLPTLETLLRLAKVLGTRAAELLEEPQPHDEWLGEVATVAATIPRQQRSLALALLKTVATHR